MADILPLGFTWKTRCCFGVDDFLVSSHIKSRLLPRGRMVLALLLLGVASWGVLVGEAAARRDTELIGRYGAFILGAGIMVALLAILSYRVNTRRRLVVFDSERIQIAGFRPREINRIELRASRIARLVFFTADAAVIVVQIPPDVSMTSIQTTLGTELLHSTPASKKRDQCNH